MQYGISRTLSELEVLRDRMKKDLEIMESFWNKPRKEINIPEEYKLTDEERKRAEEIKNNLRKEFENATEVFRFTNIKFDKVNNRENPNNGHLMQYSTIVAEACKDIIFGSSQYFKNEFYGIEEDDGSKYCYIKLVDIKPTLEHTKRYSKEYCMATDDDMDALITALYSYHVSEVEVVLEVYDSAREPKTVTFKQDTNFESFEFNELKKAFENMKGKLMSKFRLRVR